MLSSAGRGSGAAASRKHPVPDVFILTYDGLKAHVPALTGVSARWGVVILDEGHKIRNPEAAISMLVKNIPSPRRFILSGSPIQNRLKELWSLMEFAVPGRLGPLPVFEAQFANPIAAGGWAHSTPLQLQAAFHCSQTLKELIEPYLLRRLKKHVNSQLPKKTEQLIMCTMAPLQRAAYNAYIRSSEVGRIMEGRMSSFRGLTILRKITNHPWLLEQGGGGGGGSGGGEEDWDCGIDEVKRGGGGRGGGGSRDPLEHSGKLRALANTLEIWSREKRRCLIFTQGTAMLDIIQGYVESKGYRFLRMDGTTSIGSRQGLVDDFNENPENFLFLLTTRVGGVGVNLIGADRVVIFDPDWNPATDSQARERAWRLGQRRHVLIYRFFTKGTLEMHIYKQQVFKNATTARILLDPRGSKDRPEFHRLRDLFALCGDSDGEEERGGRGGGGRGSSSSASASASALPPPEIEVGGVGVLDREKEEEEEEEEGGGHRSKRRHIGGAKSSKGGKVRGKKHKSEGGGKGGRHHTRGMEEEGEAEEEDMGGGWGHESGAMSSKAGGMVKEEEEEEDEDGDGVIVVDDAAEGRRAAKIELEERGEEEEEEEEVSEGEETRRVEREVRMFSASSKSVVAAIPYDDQGREEGEVEEGGGGNKASEEEEEEGGRCDTTILRAVLDSKGSAMPAAVAKSLASLPPSLRNQAVAHGERVARDALRSVGGMQLQQQQQSQSRQPSPPPPLPSSTTTAAAAAASSSGDGNGGGGVMEDLFTMEDSGPQRGYQSVRMSSGRPNATFTASAPVVSVNPYTPPSTPSLVSLQCITPGEFKSGGAPVLCTFPREPRRITATFLLRPTTTTVGEASGGGGVGGGGGGGGEEGKRVPQLANLPTKIVVLQPSATNKPLSFSSAPRPLSAPPLGARPSLLTPLLSFKLVKRPSWVHKGGIKAEFKASMRAQAAEAAAATAAATATDTSADPAPLHSPPPPPLSSCALLAKLHARGGITGNVMVGRGKGGGATTGGGGGVGGGGGGGGGGGLRDGGMDTFGRSYSGLFRGS